MKKIVIFLLAIATLPVAAADAPTSNSGWQFGLGIPLATPLTSVNGFIGYVDKSAPNWWTRRFGFRADFAVPSRIKFKGRVVGEDVHLRIKTLGIKYDLVLHDLIEPIIVRDDHREITVNTQGITGIVKMENQYLGGLVDFYPFGDTWFWGGWRFSGGYYAGRMDMSVTANIPHYTPDDLGYAVNVINNLDVIARLKADTTARASVHWKYHGPYAGLGFDLGIFRGLKFYLDAGVVFANAPKIRDTDLYIPESNIQGCISIAGQCSPWTSINIRNPGAAADQVLTGLVVGLKSGNHIFGGVDYSAIIGQIPDDILVSSGISNWLTGGPRPTFVDDLINFAPGVGVGEVVAELENLRTGLQELTDHYVNGRRDAVREVNEKLSDIRFVPMLRVGFMYRF
ncbi:MAG: hypothetical protein FWF34_01225 [Alphaproteobacteria bacterium]|nr:hypothetical protein [Alphaproteobacteria bacterium]MCL2889863.1 hypothetical protein [Alphaproteobacteria bacterium]